MEIMKSQLFLQEHEVDLLRNFRKELRNYVYYYEDYGYISRNSFSDLIINISTVTFDIVSKSDIIIYYKVL